MQRFKNILVLTDGGPRSRVALERAAALAESNKARLTALSVLESLPVELQRLVAAIHLAALWEQAVEERKQKLDRLVSKFGARMSTLRRKSWAVRRLSR